MRKSEDTHFVQKQEKPPQLPMSLHIARVERAFRGQRVLHMESMDCNLSNGVFKARICYRSTMFRSVVGASHSTTFDQHYLVKHEGSGFHVKSNLKEHFVAFPTVVSKLRLVLSRPCEPRLHDALHL